MKRAAIAVLCLLLAGCSGERSGLIRVGEKAPMLTLTTPTGNPLNLADVLKGKKALVLDFWFYD